MILLEVFHAHFIVQIFFFHCASRNVLPETFCFQLMQKIVWYNVKYCQETHVFFSKFVSPQVFYRCEFEIFSGNPKVFWDQWSHGPIHFPPVVLDFDFESKLRTGCDTIV